MNILKALPELLMKTDILPAITQKFSLSRHGSFPYRRAKCSFKQIRGISRKSCQNSLEDRWRQTFPFSRLTLLTTRTWHAHGRVFFPEFLPDKIVSKFPNIYLTHPLWREELGENTMAPSTGDACAGSIIGSSKRKRLLKNTLIIFTS